MPNAGFAGFGAGLERLGLMLAQKFADEDARKREEERYRAEQQRAQTWRSEDIARADRLRSEDIARQEDQRREQQFAGVLANQPGNTGVSPEIAQFAEKNPYIKSMINPQIPGALGLPPTPLREMQMTPQGLAALPNVPLKRRTRADEEFEANQALRDVQTRQANLGIEQTQAALNEFRRKAGIRQSVGDAPFKSLLNVNAPISQVEAFDLESIIAQMLEGEKNRSNATANAQRVNPLQLALLPNTLYQATLGNIQEQVMNRYAPLIKSMTDIGDVAAATKITQTRDAELAKAGELAKRQANESLGPILQILQQMPGVNLPKNASQIMNFPKGMLPEEAQAQFIQQQLVPIQQRFAALTTITPQQRQEFDRAVAGLQAAPDPSLALQALDTWVNAMATPGAVAPATATPTIKQPGGGVLQGPNDPITNFLDNLLTKQRQQPIVPRPNVAGTARFGLPNLKGGGQ